MVCFILRPHGYKATGGKTEPKPSDKLSIRNVVSPYFLPVKEEGNRKVSRRSAGMGVWRKQKPSCNGMDRDKCPDTKVCRLPRGDLSQESLKNFLKRGKQMYAIACAPYDADLKMGRFKFDFKTLRANVRKLQIRIVKAQQTDRYNKVKALQWLLTHSLSAKILAVKRVTENKGKDTPGVDNIVWKTDKQKCEAVRGLRRAGYTAEPLRRVFIPKKNGKKRGLGIPTVSANYTEVQYPFGMCCNNSSVSSAIREELCSP